MFNVNLIRTLACSILLISALSCSDGIDIVPEELPEDSHALKSLLEDDISDELRLEVYHKLYKLNRTNNIELAEVYIHKQLELAKAIEDKLYEGKAYHAKGLLDKSSGKYINALNSYLHAVNLFEGRDAARMADDINNIGNIFLETRGYKDAIPYLEKAASIYKSIDDLRFLLRTYTNLAICHSNLEDFTMAAKYLNKALDLQRQVDNTNSQSLAHMYNELGNISYFSENYEDAIKYYMEGLSFEPIEDQMRVMLFDNIANVFVEKGEYKEADDWLKRGETFEIDNKTKIERHNIYGRLYQLQGKHQKALAVLNEAVAIADKEVINEPLISTLELLSISHRTLTANNIRVDYKDIYFVEDLKDQQTALKTKFTNDLDYESLHIALNKEIERFNGKVLKASMENQRWIVIQWTGFIIVGLLIILTVTLIRANILKKEYNRSVATIRDIDRMANSALEKLKAD